MNENNSLRDCYDVEVKIIKMYGECFKSSESEKVKFLGSCDIHDRLNIRKSWLMNCTVTKLRVMKHPRWKIIGGPVPD